MQLDGTRTYITATVKFWNYYLFCVTLTEYIIFWIHTTRILVTQIVSFLRLSEYTSMYNYI